MDQDAPTGIMKCPRHYKPMGDRLPRWGTVPLYRKPGSHRSDAPEIQPARRDKTSIAPGQLGTGFSRRYIVCTKHKRSTDIPFLDTITLPTIATGPIVALAVCWGRDRICTSPLIQSFFCHWRNYRLARGHEGLRPRNATFIGTSRSWLTTYIVLSGFDLEPEIVFGLFM